MLECGGDSAHPAYAHIKAALDAGFARMEAQLDAIIEVFAEQNAYFNRLEAKLDELSNKHGGGNMPPLRR